MNIRTILLDQTPISTEFDCLWDNNDEVTLKDNIRNVLTKNPESAVPQAPKKNTGFFEPGNKAKSANESADEQHQTFILQLLNKPELILSEFYNSLCSLYAARTRIFKESEGRISRKVQYLIKKIDAADPTLKEDGRKVMIAVHEMEVLRHANEHLRGGINYSSLNSANEVYRSGNRGGI